MRIQIEGFRPIQHEVALCRDDPRTGKYEPLIGYLVLKHSQAGVGMLGRRLVPVKPMDLK